MDQFLKVGEIERKGVVEQDNLILLPISSIALFIIYVTRENFVCHDTRTFATHFY